MTLRAVRAWIAAFLLSWPALAAAQPMAPAEPIEGLYVAQIFETATAIELTADGRFQWIFSQGSLDLFGEGRWTREGEDALLLDSDPPVVPPAVELVGTGRGRGAEVVVRLDEASGEAWPFLDVEAEFADGTRVREPFREAEHRIDGGGRVVALRLGSVPFDFQSGPFPVETGNNVMIFRLVPNDIGREDFRARRVAVEPDALSLEWRGETLRYLRANERGEPAVDCGPGEAGPRRLVVGLAEPFADTLAASSYDLDADRSPYDGPIRSGCTAIDLSIRFRGHQFDAGVIGGSDLLEWSLEPSAVGRVESVSFYHQDRLFELAEALERARSVESWFERAGFVPHPAPGVADDGSYRPFEALDGITGERGASWDEAASLLADEANAIGSMHLFTMRQDDYYGRVTISNLRRSTTDGSGEAYVRTSEGREWVLAIHFFLDPEILMGINFPSRPAGAGD